MENSTSLDEATAKKVIRQVEFYFSDSNLPRDSFLMQSINDSEDGMVSLGLICSFSRMRSHLGLGEAKPDDISVDTVAAVAETLRTSSVLKISEDGQRVGRTKELPNPDEVIEQLDVRTIAASSLPYDVSIEDVESFFAQYAKVNSVRLPRHVANKKVFSGTALIEFSSAEDATKVLEQSLVYDGIDLELKPKKDFDEERTKQEEAAAISRRHGSKHENNANPQESYPKGLILAFKLKKITADGATNDNGGNELKPSEDVQTENVNADGHEEKEVQKAGVDAETPQSDGIELAKENFDAMKDNKDVVLREDLKSTFQKFGTIKYIDFRMGSESGYIRFEDADGSQMARAAAVLAVEGGVIVKNFIAILDPLQGEAEKEYWSQILKKKQHTPINKGKNKHSYHDSGRRHKKTRHN